MKNRFFQLASLIIILGLLPGSVISGTSERLKITGRDSVLDEALAKAPDDYTKMVIFEAFSQRFPAIREERRSQRISLSKKLSRKNISTITAELLLNWKLLKPSINIRTTICKKDFAEHCMPDHQN